MNARTAEDIEAVLSGLREDSKALTKKIAEICWYMRGSITWDQAWNLDNDSIKSIIKIIDENVKRTKDTGMPLL